MENKIEIPGTSESYVEEFLTAVKDEQGNPLAVLAEDFFQDRTTYWLEEFCKELNHLRQINKLVDKYINYL